MKHEITVLSDRTCPYSGRTSILCIPRQNEKMDVNGPENPGAPPQGHGAIGDGSRIVDSLCF